jgi:formylglycine-generating enzyme required for sulfatase activity
MPLSKQQRLAIIDFLVPLLNDEGKRQMHIELLFAGESRRPDINLHGGPRETTTRIVLALETYQIEQGKPALVDLLQQVTYDVGVDHQALIEEWQKALLTPISAQKPPSPQAPSSPIPVSAGLAEAPKSPSPKQLPVTPSSAELFAMPAPFAWITIPAGKVTLEAKNESYLKTETTFDVSSFGIGKYPITLGQYVKFIQAGGYHTKDWWTKKGWQSLSEDRPKTQERKSSLVTVSEMRPNQPAPVTWFEAVAFCAWLHATIDEPVTLPNEHQWQRAAQGDDNRLYPWGSDWNAKACNNQNTHLTSVYKYEDVGQSPYGLVDMVGNAAEWTLTNWRTGEEGGDGDVARVVRGGAYTNQHLNFYRVTTRHKEWPTTLCGFRIVRLLE